MISFENDYSLGVHPKILQRLIETNMEALPGYGTDHYCKNAIKKIQEACECPKAQVYFLVGGTQTNSIIISAMLHSYEGVIAAKTGHINTHEAGAVEYTGHKVLELPEHQGKLNAEEIRAYLKDFYEDENHEHEVFPGMVYLSWPTEYGTLYSRKELEDISSLCGEYEIPLFLDGARLGYGLMSAEADLSLSDIARLCDVFYIGGTKIGALCGEAVVFPRGNAPKHFMTMVKQHGAMLAKGRLLGIQFDALFTDNLYLNISRNAIQMAARLKTLLHQEGLTFYLESPTNQQFVILENEIYKRLQKNVALSFWSKYDETHTVVRFATSWSTTEKDLEELAEFLKASRS